MRKRGVNEITKEPLSRLDLYLRMGLYAAAASAAMRNSKGVRPRSSEFACHPLDHADVKRNQNYEA